MRSRSEERRVDTPAVGQVSPGQGIDPTSEHPQPQGSPVAYGPPASPGLLGPLSSPPQQAPSLSSSGCAGLPPAPTHIPWMHV